MNKLKLIELLPTVKENIIDVVKNVGHDIKPWGLKDEGKTTVSKPNVNPNYCYRWSFSEEGKSPLLCLWHHELNESDGIIFHENNAREEAIRLEKTTENPSTSTKEINRAKKRAKEARRMNTCVMDAFRKKIPVRVAIVFTKKPFKNNLEPASADLRQLDDKEWIVSTYEMDTGRYVLERGGSYKTISEISDEKYEDQFSGNSEVAYKDQTGKAAIRDSNVRAQVLIRASGVCEHCNMPGFLTKSGKVYLETHHIIPLSEGGADKPNNMIALCPNDHRKAHFSSEHAELKQSFFNKLK